MTRFRYSKHTLSIPAILLSALLAGCGGSSGGKEPTPPVINPDGGGNTTPTWTAGVYEPASQFINQCSAPRSGTDPYTNEAYPDKAGSVFLEKMYLRSFSNETYLWYDELPDPNPNSYNSVISYFDILRTTQVTDSGRDKDEFHFVDTYENYMQESQSGLTGGYGINWAFIETYAPRDLKVAYTETASGAELAGVERGDKLLKINAIDFVNTNASADIDAINEALFYPQMGKSYRFTFETRTGSTKTVTLTAAQIALSPVKNIRVIENQGRKVGYLQHNQFISAAQSGLIQAFSQFSTAGIDELVIDMRYNGGGLIYQSAQLGYMIAGSGSQNRVFETLAYNDKRSAYNESINFVPRAIDWDQSVFTDPLPYVGLSKVYILSTSGTASASESLINALRGIDVEVILIGGQTRGKPYGFLPQQNCGLVYFTVQFKGVNEKNFGDYADGFIPTPASNIVTDMGVDAKVPGCTVADDFSQPLGDEQEAMLAAALQYMQDGTCPAVPVKRNLNAPQSLQGRGLAIEQPFHPLRQGSIYTDIRDLTQ
ncbi:S41 family peptidase [Shewanella sp. GXUN23E]|uniref:S41 family peptidase n=1 Tax=Shewanella sp. GXUN23E TaxID=3422498 RepID=UPI003D7CC1D1